MDKEFRKIIPQEGEDVEKIERANAKRLEAVAEHSLRELEDYANDRFSSGERDPITNRLEDFFELIDILQRTKASLTQLEETIYAQGRLMQEEIRSGKIDGVKKEKSEE